MHRRVDLAAVPPGRTVVRFRFPDVSPPARDWWLVISDGVVDVCDADPGHPVTVGVTAPLRVLTRVWRGDTGWADAVVSGDLVVDASTAVRRAVPGWFALSIFAAVPRPALATVGPAPGGGFDESGDSHA